jgi:DNA polymerase-3 subunit epsilon
VEAAAVPIAVPGAVEPCDTPLAEVDFVVLDLETTGCSPAGDAITEIGAVKYRGGVCEGELQTLVNPGTDIPVAIATLTGISDAMVSPAPSVASVLPSLLEFIGQAVLVGHNLRFDVSFLDAALTALGYPPLEHRRLDTVLLARRLFDDETANHRLATLARHVRTSRVPIHRALDDARATADLLHALLERAGTLGLVRLDDLLVLSRISGRDTLAKLKLTRRVPRRPGVYVFRDVAGNVVHTGSAQNMRDAVLAYFGDPRKKVRDLLARTFAIDHVTCAVDGSTPLPGR